MKVKELIEKLKKLDSEAYVMLPDVGCGCCSGDDEAITAINTDTDGQVLLG